MEVSVRRDKWQRQMGVSAHRIMFLREALTKEPKFKRKQEIGTQIYEAEKIFWQEVGAFSEAEEIRLMVDNRIKEEESEGLHEAGS